MIFNYDRLIFFNIMSPIQYTNHEQEFYESCDEFEQEQEQSSSIQQQDQSPEPPREFMIERLFSIVSRLEITRHYAIHISVDDVEDMLVILDRSIKECEDYYGPYRNRHALFFSIIDGAKEFLHFIREDQDRGLPSMDNQYI